MKKFAIARTIIAICLTSVHVQAQPQEVSPLKIFSELSETDREFPEMDCDRRYNNCRAFEVKDGVLYIYGHGHLWTRDPAYNLTSGDKSVVEVTARLHISKDGKHKGHCSGLIVGFASNLDRWRADSESDALTFSITCSENANFYTAVRTGMYRKFIGTTNFIMPPDRWQKVKIVLSTENLQAFVEGEEVINVDLAKVDFPKTGYVGILGYGALRSEIQYLKINGHEEISDSDEFRGARKRTPPRVKAKTPPLVEPLYKRTPKGYERIIGPAHEEISDPDEFRGSRKRTLPRVKAKTPPPVEPLYKRTPKGYERIIGPAVAQSSYAGLYVYPKHGQSADRQSQDAGQCDRSAVEVTGYDPAHPPTATHATNSLGDQGRTMAKGAVVGSATSSAVGAAAGAAMGGAVGAVAGAVAGAAGGAVAGLLGGSMVARRDQQAKTHQDQVQHAQHHQEYVRAFSACMDARGYSVR